MAKGHAELVRQNKNGIALKETPTASQWPRQQLPAAVTAKLALKQQTLYRQFQTELKCKESSHRLSGKSRNKFAQKMKETAASSPNKGKAEKVLPTVL